MLMVYFTEIEMLNTRAEIHYGNSVSQRRNGALINNRLSRNK